MKRISFYFSWAPMLGLLAMCVWLGGCTPEVSGGGFDGDDPSSRLYGVVKAGDAGDWGAVPDLIDELGSADQAVRMYAIESLSRITGRRYGYVAYETASKRHAAMERWMAAYREGELDGEKLNASEGSQ